MSGERFFGRCLLLVRMATRKSAAAASVAPRSVFGRTNETWRVLSYRLRSGSEENFVDVDVIRLADGKRDTAGECTGSDGDPADEIPGACLDVPFADMLEEFGTDCTGRDDGCPDIVGSKVEIEI